MSTAMENLLSNRIQRSQLPLVVDTTVGSPAAIAGLRVGDRLLRVNGVVLRDIIEWNLLTDDEQVDLELLRGNDIVNVLVEKQPGESLGLQIDSPVFDRVRTCDNHCDFCFIYQLPKGLRKSLYLKDDDYRLSFLYGNFTTLTRFTEADLERIITDRISPLNVSVHSADPELRARMLRNDRGAISLRWMKVLLESGIRIRAQIVLSPEVNDGVELDRTLTTILDEYPGLDSVAIVPLGLSKFNPESHLRVHTRSEAEELIAQVFLWQSVFSECLGHPMVFAADEFYILADQDWPAAVTYGDFSMYEDGIGMVRHLQEEFNGHITPSQELTPDFFHSVDLGAKYGAQYERNPVADTSLRRQSPEPNAEQMVMIRPRARHGASHQKVIMTGEYGYVSLVSTVPANSTDVTFLAVKNNYFGGNTAVTGLLVGEDINIALAGLDSDCEIYLPDVCLSDGRFLDGKTVADLVRPVHVVPTNGHTLRQIIEG